jgi:mannose-1-phosphate guanylyltransferase
MMKINLVKIYPLSTSVEPKEYFAQKFKSLNTILSRLDKSWERQSFTRVTNDEMATARTPERIKIKARIMTSPRRHFY